MNLDESTRYLEQQKTRETQRKLVVATIIICVILIILLAILIAYIKNVDAHTEKFFLNSTKITVSKDFYVILDEKGNKVEVNDKTAFVETEGSTNKVYMNVTELAKLLKYIYTKGAYETYDQDVEAGYFSSNYQLITVAKDAEDYRKYSLTIPDKSTLGGIAVSTSHENGEYEEFVLSSPIRIIKDNYYVALTDIEDMFEISLTWNQYRKNIDTLETLVTKYAGPTLKKAGAQSVSGYYENFKALLYGYLVVNDGSNYGVVNINGETVISMRYSKIVFLQNARQFYVTSNDGNNTYVGLFDLDGTTVVKTNTYDSLKLVDTRNNLYLASKNKLFGLIRGTNGKIVVHVNYDDIGYDFSVFNDPQVLSNYLLCETCIPVKADGKYGLYDLESGEIILNVNYDSFGYKASTAIARDEGSMLTLDKDEFGITGIIICQNGKYGVYDVTNKKLATPVIYDKIFTRLGLGETQYLVEYNGVSSDLHATIDTYLESINPGYTSRQRVTAEITGDDTTDETTVDIDSEE